jgi:GntR family transcriptional regulator
MLKTDYIKLIDELQLNNQTSEPYYLQLKRKITELIESGALPISHGLPAERKLAETLNISRTTVRRCYLELRQTGILIAHAQGGTLVSEVPRISPQLGKLKGFTEEMAEMGMVATTKIVSHDIVNDRTIASVFKRPSTSNFLKLVRIRYADNTPMTREIAWYDLTTAPALANWDISGSAYAYLVDKCNIKLVDAEQSIEAILSSEEEAEAFNFKVNQACLLLKRKTFTSSGQLVEYVEGTFRGDAYAYRFKMTV